MNYGRAIEICTNLDLEEFSESEIIEAVSTILDMATINAVPKAALLNVVRYFWAHCVEQLQAGEDEDVISRAAAVKAIMGEHPDAHYPDWYAEQIKKLPAADVKPVVIGQWEQTADGYDFDGNLIFDSWHCSSCGYEADGEDEPDFLYCPNCGADMREGSAVQELLNSEGTARNGARTQ